MDKVVKMSLHVSPEMNDIIEEMSEEMHASKSDVLRKSIALMKVALDNKKKGYNIGVVNKDKQLINEIVGL